MSRLNRLLAFVPLLFAAHSASAADIRVTGVSLSYFTRAGAAATPAAAPARGSLIAVRCDFTVDRARNEALGDWSLAFMAGDQELDRVLATGLVEPQTGQSSRTWYGRIIGDGAHDIACVADPDGEVAETTKSNNRAATTLTIPGAAAQRRTAAPAERAAPALTRATATEAALARGGAPSIDLHFTDAAGVRPVGARDAVGSVQSAAVGQPLLVDCNYRAALDAPNGEPVPVPAYAVQIERNGTQMARTDGVRNFVSLRGASRAGLATERWTPLAAGRYVLRCVLDPDGTLAEVDETNNALEIVVEVTGGRAAAAAATAAAPPQNAVLAPSVSAQLGYQMPGPADSQVTLLGSTEQTVYAGDLDLRLQWASQQAAQFQWRWQAALWPFPSDPAIEPPALLAEGPVSGTNFTVDLAAFPPLGEVPAPTSAQQGAAPPTAANASAAPGALPPAAGRGAVSVNPAARTLPQAPRTGAQTPTGAVPPTVDAPSGTLQAQAGTSPAATAVIVPPAAAPDVPLDVYVRIVPYSAGNIAAPPSNFVVAHYLPGESPAAAEASAAVTNAAQQDEKLAAITAEAEVYALQVVDVTKAYLQDVNRWGCVIVDTNPYEDVAFHPLSAYAPGEHCPKVDPAKQEKDFGEKLLEAVAGWGHAWNGLSWAFNQAKSFVATQFAKSVPCEWLGDDLQDDCESIAKTAAESAISAGLVAAGVPPSLPDLDAMAELAKGEVVNGAVEFTCEVIESKNGECTPEIRAGLEELYEAGVNELQAAATRQISEPACGDTQTANELGLLPMPCFGDYEGTKVLPAPGATETPPKISVRVTRTKPDPDFPMSCSITASFVLHNTIEGFNTQTGELWTPVTVPVPALTVGQSQVVAFELGPRKPFSILGPQGATLDWYEFLSGASATLGVGTATAQAVAPGPAGPVKVTCSKPLLLKLQLPQNVQTETPWVLL